MGYQKIVVPADGDKIKVNADLSLNVPNHPIIPFIEGDGIGVDITPTMKAVVDAAILKAYGGKRSIEWMEVYCGEKANKIYGNYMPEETFERSFNHTSRWRYSFTQRCIAPRIRSICLRTSSALV